MNDPCLCEHIVTTDELRRYNQFKWGAFLTLLLLAVLLLLGARNRSDVPRIAQAGTAVQAGVVQLSGTGSTPGNVVEILLDGAVIGRAPVDRNGNWSVAVQLPEPGDYTLTTRALQSNGQAAGPLSSPQQLTVLSPVTPTHSGPPTFDLPTAANADASAALSGRAVPGSGVVILNNGAQVASTTADDAGNWTTTVANLRYRNTLQAVGVARDGSDLGRSVVQEWIVPAAAAALQVDGVPQWGEPSAAADGQVAGRLQLAGRGEPDGAVELTLNGQAIGRAPIDADGAWRFDTTLTLPPGNYDLAARMAASNGDTLGQIGPFPLQAALPAAAPTLGQVTANPDGSATLSGTAAPNAPVAIVIDGTPIDTVTADGDGKWSYFFAPAAGAVGTFTFQAGNPDAALLSEPQTATLSGAPLTMRLLEGGNADPGTVVLQGRALPGATVELRADGAAVATATADDAGNWSATLALTPGPHTVEALAQRADGSPYSASGALNARSGDEPPALSLDEVALAADSADGVILSGRGRPGARVEIVLDDVVVESTTVGSDGRWGVALPNTRGARLSARAAGPGDADLPVEIAPIALAGANGETEVSITEIGGGATADSELTIAGRAPANRTVRLLIDGAPVETLTADADGNWRYVTRRPDGRYTATAQLLDEAGQVAALASLPTTFIVGSPPTGVAVNFAGIPAGVDPVAFALTSPFLQAVPTVHIIFDASWSMVQPLEDGTRIAVAREALAGLVAALPEGAPVALRAFGNIEGNLSCRTDLMLPLGPLNRAALTELVAGIEPQFNANTAIAASLEQVTADLATADDRPQVVILLTDGEETCGGDPTAVVQRLAAQGLDIRLNIVGLAIANQALQEQFQALAALGNGSYFNASNSDELRAGLIQAMLTPYRLLTADGAVAAQGYVDGDPITAPPGVYRIVIGTTPEQTIDNVVIEPARITQATVE